MAELKIEGLEEFQELIQEMTLTDQDETKAMKKAIGIITDEVERNTPERSEGMKKGIKKQVKKEDFATVGIVKMGTWYTQFQEFGTSQQKANVGFFERSVNKTKNEAVSTLADSLLNSR